MQTPDPTPRDEMPTPPIVDVAPWKNKKKKSPPQKEAVGFLETTLSNWWRR